MVDTKLTGLAAVTPPVTDADQAYIVRPGAPATSFQATIEQIREVNRWDDLKIDSGKFSFAGTSDPTLVNWQPGGAGPTFKLYEFALSDEAFFEVQLPHSYKEGEDLEPHLHWTPAGRGVTEIGNDVAWQLDYTIASVDAAFPSGSTLTAVDTVAGTDHQHQVVGLGTISGASLKVSDIIIGRIARIATGDTWTGVGTGNLPLFLSMDFHIRKDFLGSNNEFTK